MSTFHTQHFLYQQSKTCTLYHGTCLRFRESLLERYCHVYLQLPHSRQWPLPSKPYPGDLLVRPHFVCLTGVFECSHFLSAVKTCGFYLSLCLDYARWFNFSREQAWRTNAPRLHTQYTFGFGTVERARCDCNDESAPNFAEMRV